VARSLKKGPYIDEKLIKKIEARDAEGKKKIVLSWARNSMISPEMVGHTIGVHNGKKHIPIYITENMVGHKLGEFSMTRHFKTHSGNRSAAVTGATS